FWALALLKQREYALAGVPMLPVVAGEKETARQMLWYALGTVAISLMLTPLGVAGEVYLVSALALGAWLLALTWRLNQTLDRATALQLYLYSLFYLFALFGAMVTDRALRWLTL
ncbi:MAG: UbiA family prenyltransferase, partial [Thermoflexales bacterium]|nr:UbiA family prenyltransferase [Thermoflexales bacterium]